MFFQGAGKEVCDVIFYWRGINGDDGTPMPNPTPGEAGAQASKLILQSDHTISISLSLFGGDGGDGGDGAGGTPFEAGGSGTNGGDAGDTAEFYLSNCHFTSFSRVVGTIGFGGEAGADGGYGGGTAGSNGLPGDIIGGTFSWCDVPTGYTSNVNDIFIATTVEGAGSLVTNGNVVALSNLAQASATKKIIGRKTAGAGNYEECVISDFINVTEHYMRTVDFTSSSTAVADVSGMSCSVATNEKLLIEIVGFQAGGASGDGIKIAFTGPSSPTHVRYSLTHFTTVAVVRSDAAATSFNTDVIETSGTNIMLPFKVILTLINGVNPGTVQFRAGAEGTGTPSITIPQGLTMRVHRVP